MSGDTVPQDFRAWLKRYVGKQDANTMRFSVAELEIAFNAGRTTPAPAMPSRETDKLREALEKIARAYDEWDPDARFASTALSIASATARAALSDGSKAE